MLCSTKDSLPNLIFRNVIYKNQKCNNFKWIPSAKWYLVPTTVINKIKIVVKNDPHVSNFTEYFTEYNRNQRRFQR